MESLGILYPYKIDAVITETLTIETSLIKEATLYMIGLILVILFNACQVIIVTKTQRKAAGLSLYNKHIGLQSFAVSGI